MILIRYKIISCYFCVKCVLVIPRVHQVMQRHWNEDCIRFKEKRLDAGADYVITQIFFDINLFRVVVWLEKLGIRGINVSEFIAGIWPANKFNVVIKYC